MPSQIPAGHDCVLSKVEEFPNRFERVERELIHRRRMGKGVKHAGWQWRKNGNSLWCMWLFLLVLSASLLCTVSASKDSLSPDGTRASTFERKGYPGFHEDLASQRRARAIKESSSLISLFLLFGISLVSASIVFFFAVRYCTENETELPLTEVGGMEKDEEYPTPVVDVARGKESARAKQSDSNESVSSLGDSVPKCDQSQVTGTKEQQAGMATCATFQESVLNQPFQNLETKTYHNHLTQSEWVYHDLRTEDGNVSPEKITTKHKVETSENGTNSTTSSRPNLKVPAAVVDVDDETPRVLSPLSISSFNAPSISAWDKFVAQISPCAGKNSSGCVQYGTNATIQKEKAEPLNDGKDIVNESNENKRSSFTLQAADIEMAKDILGDEAASQGAEIFIWTPRIPGNVPQSEGQISSEDLFDFGSEDPEAFPAEMDQSLPPHHATTCDFREYAQEKSLLSSHTDSTGRSSDQDSLSSTEPHKMLFLRRGPLVIAQHVLTKELHWIAALRGTSLYLAVVVPYTDKDTVVALPQDVFTADFRALGVTIITSHIDNSDHLEPSADTINCYQYKNDPICVIIHYVRCLTELVVPASMTNKKHDKYTERMKRSSPLAVCRIGISLMIGRIKSNKKNVRFLSGEKLRKRDIYVRDIRDAATTLLQDVLLCENRDQHSGRLKMEEPISI